MSPAERSHHANLRAKDFTHFMRELQELSDQTDDRFELMAIDEAISGLIIAVTSLERAGRIASIYALAQDTQRERLVEQLRASIELVGKSPEKMRAAQVCARTGRES